MSYNYSQVDYDNLKWFENDLEPQSLCQMNLRQGKIRGIHPFELSFEYPITAIAGKNGSGKSTILAMVCCAYHNVASGYVPFERNKNYYTFSDFFISTYDEEKPEGIAISYCYLGSWRNYRTGETYSHGWLNRKKRKGGKWTDYNTRVKRNVIFFGIQRIVPPSERKTDRSYSRKFRSANLDEKTKQRILDIAGRIMGKKYVSLDLRTVNQRRLFVVDRPSQHYSGFNMGAGENAIFSILIELFLSGKGTLIVIDEIELGLHEEAQKRFVDELKLLCRELHCQVVCSTHSGRILDALPPEGRKFVETYNNQTEILTGISSDYARGLLSGTKTDELTILVEDEVAKSIIREILPPADRSRVNILPIGSDGAVLRQLAAHFREGDYACIAFLDGDKESQFLSAKGTIKKHLETKYNGLEEDEFDTWLSNHLRYLPGGTCPEKWLIDSVDSEGLLRLGAIFGMENDQFASIVEQASCAPTHKEFYLLSQKIGVPESQIRTDFIREVAVASAYDIPHIIRCVEDTLSEFES